MPAHLTSKIYVDTAINTKQNIINDGDLSITKTLNLQNSLDVLQNNINLKQNIINDGDLTISKILDLQIILDGKQDVTTNNTSSSSSPSILSTQLICVLAQVALSLLM